MIAEGYERIHRSNLIGMGVLPLQFLPEEGAEALGLDGTELFDVEGISAGLEPGGKVRVTARSSDGRDIPFEDIVLEWAYMYSQYEAMSEQVDILRNECVCDCNYSCTCDCNYCVCNCNYVCQCDCNYT